MQDYLSAEARDDAEEETPRVFVIAGALKEIEWARVSVEKGKVKEREFESGEKELNTNRKKLSNLNKFDKQWSYLFLVPVLAVSCSVT